MYVFLGIAILFLIVAYIGSELLKRDTPAKKLYTYARKEYFLTQREAECYKQLVSMIGNEYFIFAQVSFGSLLDERKPGQNWKAARAHINRKSVDFLLCDKQFISPKLAIELDDSTHNRPDRVERDQTVEDILREAGIPLLRVRKTDELVERLRPTLA